MSIEIVSVINEEDNVAIANLPIMKGDVIPLSDHVITAKGEIPKNSMLTTTAIKESEPIFCFGYPVARAAKDLLRGESVSAYNCSALKAEDEALIRAIASERMREALVKNENNPSKIKMAMRNNRAGAGFKSLVVVLAPEERMEEAKSLFPKAVVMEAQKRDYVRLHPNVHSILHPFEKGESTENEVYLANQAPEKAKAVYQELTKKAIDEKLRFAPCADVTLEIMGSSPSWIVNEAVGGMVDRLTYLGATVIVDLEEDISLCRSLISERMGSEEIPSTRIKNKGTFARELASLRVTGEGKIAGFTDGGKSDGAGLWLNIDQSPTLANLALNLSGKRELSPLAVPLPLDVEEEDKVIIMETLLLAITAAVRP
jgi:hypothetical protein